MDTLTTLTNHEKFRQRDTFSSSMAWIQNLMKKKSLRRRQSKSPSSPDSSLNEPRSFFGSKHKKRTFRKDSSTEGESMCSQSSADKTDKAAWRVGTFSTQILAPTSCHPTVVSTSDGCYIILTSATNHAGRCSFFRKYSSSATNRRRMVG